MAPESGTQKLSSADIAGRLAHMSGWAAGAASAAGIARQYTFPSFPDAIAFVTRLAFAAEAADHHPDLLVSYRKVTVTWSTHSAGGVTEKDFAGAGQADRAAAQLGGK